MGLIHTADLDRVWANTATPQSGSAAPHKPGDIARVPTNDGTGDKYFVFVHNDTASAIAQGEVAAIVAAGGFSVAKGAALNQDKNALAGIVQRAAGLPADHYGWVQCWGRGVALSDATGWVAGNLLVVDAAGATDVITAVTDSVIAVARAASGVSGVAAVDICIRTA